MLLIEKTAYSSRFLLAERPLSNPNPEIYIGSKWIKIYINLIS